MTKVVEAARRVVDADTEYQLAKAGRARDNAWEAYKEAVVIDGGFVARALIKAIEALEKIERLGNQGDDENIRLSGAFHLEARRIARAALSE